MTKLILLIGAAAAALVLAAGLPLVASAAPVGPVADARVDARVDGRQELLQPVADRYRYHRRYYRGTHVWAPFTDVDTRHGTYVAAPFARVYSGRRGTWVRAPFVNLFVPR